MGNSTIYSFFKTGTPSYEIKALVNSTAGGNFTVQAYISSDGASYYLIRGVLFYNGETGQYRFVGPPDGEKPQINYTLFMVAQNNSIVNAQLLGSNLANTNLFKLMYLCNQYQCAFGSKNLTLSLVYENPDSRIYKINYLN